jgi:hypothetical protein
MQDGKDSTLPVKASKVQYGGSRPPEYSEFRSRLAVLVKKDKRRRKLPIWRE